MPFGHQSPLLAMAPLTTSSPLRASRAHDQGTSSSSDGERAGPSASVASQHQIPFPSSSSSSVQGLTFGFGFQPSATGNASGSTSSSHHGWGQPPAATQRAASLASPSTHRRADVKRRRSSTSDSDSESEHMSETMRERSESPASAARLLSRSRHISTGPQQQNFPKRMRAGIGLMSLDDGPHTLQKGKASASSSSFSQPRPPSAAERPDVGKMLSTLDKSSLLTLFSRLLSTTKDSTLPEQILSLIPSPSLAAVEASLEESERTIRSACAHAGDMRPEFAWGRLRNPVADFVSTALGLLPFFVESKDPTNVHRESPHATTTFAFLHLITSRTLEILAILPPTPTTLTVSLFDYKPMVPQSNVPALRAYQDCLSSLANTGSSNARLTPQNPNALVSQLVPLLLIQWTHFVEIVSRTVNDEGGMFGIETARGWRINLDALSRDCISPHQQRDEERAIRTALEIIRETLEARIGWLVGTLPGGGSSNSSSNNSSALFGGYSAGQHMDHGARSAKRERSASLRMDEEEEL